MRIVPRITENHRPQIAYYHTKNRGKHTLLRAEADWGPCCLCLLRAVPLTPGVLTATWGSRGAVRESLASGRECLHELKWTL